MQLAWPNIDPNLGLGLLGISFERFSFTSQISFSIQKKFGKYLY
jgi:hypothetical protein